MPVPTQVVRAACIMAHPIPNTNNAASAQIILPQKQVPAACRLTQACAPGATLAYAACVGGDARGTTAMRNHACTLHRVGIGYSALRDPGCALRR